MKKTFSYMIGIPLAILGSIPPVIGSILYGFQKGFLFAGVIEEIFKPCGIYLLTIINPQVSYPQIFIVFLGFLAGVSFSIIENIIYLFIYFPIHSSALAIYRYTVTLALHAICSSIFALGINKDFIELFTQKGVIKVKSIIFFSIAICIHTIYNIIALIFIKIS